MKEAAITHSPHANVPKKELTEEERRERYRTRIDESIRPYTVIDVLTRVYHRSIEDDLLDMKLYAPDYTQAKYLGEQIMLNPAGFYGKILDAAFSNQEEPYDLSDN